MSGYTSCPLCKHKFEKEESGANATKYLEYVKRKQVIADLREDYKNLLSTTTEQIVALKRQLQEKERELESLKKRQLREQKKSVPLGNTKIQRVSDRKNLSKSMPSSLRTSQTNLPNKNKTTSKSTLSPLSKKIHSKEKPADVKQQNNIKATLSEKKTSSHKTLSKKKNVKNIVTPEKIGLTQKKVNRIKKPQSLIKHRKNDIHEKSLSMNEKILEDIATKEFVSSVEKDEVITDGLLPDKSNTEEQAEKDLIMVDRGNEKRSNADVSANLPRHHKDASSNEEFSRFQPNKQSRSDDINSSYINLNSNSINRFMK